MLILILLLFTLSASAKSVQRRIVSVEPINVTVPVATVPQLPWQVMVTYNDGKTEWRQTVWSNSSPDTERTLADKEKNPLGNHYTVKGYIIGDNTTANGYPISANVKVIGEEDYLVPSATPIAEPLPLCDIRLTGNNRLTSNRMLDIRMLLSLDITQQLYNYRDTYGLPTDGYTVSNGWDSPTTKLKGHGTGHYLSALAHAYAGAGDDETVTLGDGKTVNIKKELYARMRRMVNELRECQERTFLYSDSLGRYFEARDYAPEAQLKSMKGSWAAFNEYKKDFAHYGYGYLNAIPAAHPVLIEQYRAYNNEEWVWAPYYTIHKQLAGLIDIANANEELAPKALLIARDMGLWVWNRLHYRTFCMKEGTTEQRRSRPGNRFEMWNIYIAGEVGGMAESLARLAEMTSDSTESARLIEAANYFDAPAFFDPVQRNIDDIRTRHANQHIPMIIGALRTYRTNRNPYYYSLANNFWNLIQGRYAYAMGGVGNGEMWRQPYTQIASMNTNVQSDYQGHRMPNPDLNETCCAYNLAKLTKDLNCYTPDDARLLDYYERVLYNQLVGSVHPEHYGVCYQYAVGLNATKPFGNATPQESCCGGTGAENHVKYPEAAYFVSDSTLYVGLYLPSEALWRGKGVRILQQCSWPAEQSVIRFRGIGGGSADGGFSKVSDAPFSVKLRVPYWATDGFDVKVNGVSVAKQYQPSSYVEIASRVWTANDSIEVVMPFTRHIFYGPDKMDMAFTSDNNGSNKAFVPQWVGTLMYGPLVMTSPDIHTWDDASLALSHDLSDVSLTSKSPFTLTVSDKTFLPDYYITDQPSTHYLRLSIPSGINKKGSKEILATEILVQKLNTALERKKSQEAWLALSVKVPEFAPWAQHGYRRLLDCISNAEQVLARAEAKSSKKRTKSQDVTQSDIDYAASSLNVAIISMRPGNLAEPEDLIPLLEAIDRVSQSQSHAQSSANIREALRYARMVIRYVNDGSGTKDMISKALNRLN